MPLFGAHESVAGGLHLAFSRIESVGGESLQIFTRNQRQWQPKPLTAEEVREFRAAREQYGAMPVASHVSYLLNLASGKNELREKSVAALILEFERCAQLGVPYVVMHPGSHGGDGVEAGLTRFVAAMDAVLAATDETVTLLLETTAGQGTGLGATFAELGHIRSASRYTERVGVCVDSCHIFAAGYDLRTPEAYASTIAELDYHVGLGQVKFSISTTRRRVSGQGSTVMNISARGRSAWPAFAIWSMTRALPECRWLSKPTRATIWPRTGRTWRCCAGCWPVEQQPASRKIVVLP